MNNPVEEAACAVAGINRHIKNEDRGHCGWRKWEEAGGALEREGEHCRQI